MLNIPIHCVSCAFVCLLFCLTPLNLVEGRGLGDPRRSSMLFGSSMPVFFYYSFWWQETRSSIQKPSSMRAKIPWYLFASLDILYACIREKKMGREGMSLQMYFSRAVQLLSISRRSRSPFRSSNLSQTASIAPKNPIDAKKISVWVYIVGSTVISFATTMGRTTNERLYADVRIPLLCRLCALSKGGGKGIKMKGLRNERLAPMRQSASYSKQNTKEKTREK